MNVRTQRVPLLGASVRAASKSLLPLDALRDARLGQTRPYLAPPVSPPDAEPRS